MPRSRNKIVKRLVLIVIDSLRADFVDPIKSGGWRMPFIQKSIVANDSCHLEVTAESPTVTMPRIKVSSCNYVYTYMDMQLITFGFHNTTNTIC